MCRRVDNSVENRRRPRLKLEPGPDEDPQLKMPLTIKRAPVVHPNGRSHPPATQSTG